MSDQIGEGGGGTSGHSDGGRADWIWLRHAPVRDQEGRYYGRLDVSAEPIDPLLVRRMATALPEGAVWLTTPLGRTRALAQALKPGVQPVEVADLTEQDFGDWQGRTYHDVFAANGTLDWENPAHLKPPEGESFAELAERVAAAIERLSAHYAGHVLIAVAHAGTIRAAIGHALGLPPDRMLSFEIAPLSMTRLGRGPGETGRARWTVGCVNRAYG